LRQHVHVPDRAALTDAAELIARFGEYAGSEAKLRADRSRDHRQCRPFLPLAADRA
jgi:hypothetical protein